MKLHFTLCTLILANTLNCEPQRERLKPGTRITIDRYTRNLAPKLTAGAEAIIQRVNWSREKHNDTASPYKNERARLLDQASRAFPAGTFPPNSTFYFVLQEGSSEACIINSSQFNVNKED